MLNFVVSQELEKIVLHQKQQSVWFDLAGDCKHSHAKRNALSWLRRSTCVSQQQRSFIFCGHYKSGPVISNEPCCTPSQITGCATIEHSRKPFRFMLPNTILCLTATARRGILFFCLWQGYNQLSSSLHCGMFFNGLFDLYN